MNQHRLIVDRSVVEWDYSSNKDAPPEDRLLYMLFYQMSRMCREKGAVRHDDRLDSLAQGVKYFTDAMGISAFEAVKARRQEDWQDILDTWLDDPQAGANHLTLGLDLSQRQKVRGGAKGGAIPKWVSI
jgi:hypothetical protein